MAMSRKQCGKAELDGERRKYGRNDRKRNAKRENVNTV